MYAGWEKEGDDVGGEGRGTWGMGSGSLGRWTVRFLVVSEPDTVLAIGRDRIG